MDYTINIRGRLLSLGQPCVMGILNVTPDSFYAASRTLSEEAIAARARQIVVEGGAIIDVGACSTRPGSTPVSCEEEMSRLRFALPIVRREAPSIPLSVDTFRSEVAAMAVDELGADMINDVGDPSLSPLDPLPVLPPNVPYVLTSPLPTLGESLLFFSRRVAQLRDGGHKDIILDPGFGFGKSVEQNYAILSSLERLQVLGLPVLAGVSRKSMIWRPLGITAAEALPATSAIHAVALMKGAAILRVHDVRDAVHVTSLLRMLQAD